VGTREDHIAEPMRDALDTTAERGAALARFVGSIPATDRGPLRALLDTLQHPAGCRSRPGGPVPNV
jgi:hypothetical protein